MWQEFVPPNREVLTRNAFRRTALETRCQLYFPAPDDDVVLLRTGFLKHIQVQCWRRRPCLSRVQSAW
jgi:hypothetical protein